MCVSLEVGKFSPTWQQIEVGVMTILFSYMGIDRLWNLSGPPTALLRLYLPAAVGLHITFVPLAISNFASPAVRVRGCRWAFTAHSRS